MTVQKYLMETTAAHPFTTPSGCYRVHERTTEAFVIHDNATGRQISLPSIADEVVTGILQ